MLKQLLTVTAAAAVLIAPMTAAQAKPKVLTCDGTYSGGTFFSVVVPAGASCTLNNVHVTHGVRARHAANVSILGSTIARNVNIRSTTGLTKIGPSDCKFDPTVGNNVMVRNSHDVLICQVTAKNNIQVTGTDGWLTVRDSVAGNNISVSRNLPFAGSLTGHPHRDAIRVFGDTAGNHIHLFGNAASRPIVLTGPTGDDTPTPVVK